MGPFYGWIWHSLIGGGNLQSFVFITEMLHLHWASADCTSYVAIPLAGIDENEFVGSLVYSPSIGSKLTQNNPVSANKNNNSKRMLAWEKEVEC